MFKWPWDKCKLVKHSVWDPTDNNLLCIYLVPGNPFDLDMISVCSKRYTLEKTHLFYKIIDKSTRSMIIAVSYELVESATINSDLI